jgi:acetylornithine deacetylase/succinyl-diaminopimelate desuccinylase-like protein
MAHHSDQEYEVIVFLHRIMTNIKKIPNTYLNLLKQFIAFKSISTDPNFSNDCQKTALWLEQLFKNSKFETRIDKGKNTNPLVMARYKHDIHAETILVYGHYDVQPAEQTDGWDHDPFTLTERDNRLSARGAIDNKGQVLVHIYSILELIKSNQLKNNIVFMIEGNEESGNLDISTQLLKHKDFLAADYVLISDGEIVKNRPTIENSFRGGSNITVNIITAPNNFHSGIFGGGVPSASLVLSQILASLKDDKNNILVPGFYDGIDSVTGDVIARNSSLATQDEILALSGVKEILTEYGLDFYTQTGLRPALEISGISSGYTGVGYLNIIPAEAEARINIRTAPGQSTRIVLDTLIKHLEKITPQYAEILITESEFSEPIILNINSEKSKSIQEILEHVYAEPVAIKNVGGSIPIVSDFVNTMKMNVISVSLANEDCNMHGVHENFDISTLRKALEFSDQLFRK